MFRRNRNTPGKPSWLRRLIGWGPLVLVLVLWGDSILFSAEFHVYPNAKRQLLVLSSSGLLYFQTWAYSVPHGDSHWFEFIHSWEAPYTRYQVIFFPRHYWVHMVYKDRAGPLQNVTTVSEFVLPLWWLAIPAALWLWFIALRHHHRYPKGTIPCPKCDYDLRGSVGASTCPECGADVKGVAVEAT